MPGGDRTGPRGLGPMTGRAAVYCGGYADVGAANPPYGYGFGPMFGRYPGMGLRRGYRGHWGVPYADFRYGPPPSPVYGSAPTRQQELEGLERQADYFEDALQDIRRRIDALAAKKTKK